MLRMYIHREISTNKNKHIVSNKLRQNSEKLGILKVEFLKTLSI